jgi:hypothetical protein
MIFREPAIMMQQFASYEKNPKNGYSWNCRFVTWDISWWGI